MKNHIDVISFLENKVIFSDNVELEKKLDLKIFSFKRFSFDQFIVMDNFKKFVVHIDEIFTFDENQFVFTFREQSICILSSRYDDLDRLLMIEKELFEFIKQFIFNLKKIDKFFIKKGILFLAKSGFFISLSGFFIFNENRIHQEIFDSNKFRLQKNISAAYSRIILSTAEMPLFLKVDEHFVSLRNSNAMAKQFSTDSKKNIVKNHVPSRKEEIDSDLSYFINMIKNKKNKK